MIAMGSVVNPNTINTKKITEILDQGSGRSDDIIQRRGRLEDSSLLYINSVFSSSRASDGTNTIYEFRYHSMDAFARSSRLRWFALALRRSMMVDSASIADCCRTKLGDGWSGDGMLCGWGRSDGMLCVVGGKRVVPCDRSPYTKSVTNLHKVCN